MAKRIFQLVKRNPVKNKYAVQRKGIGKLAAIRKYMEHCIRRIKKQELKIIQQLAFEIWPSTYASILTNEQIAYMLNLFYTDEALLNDFNKPGYQFYVLSINEDDIGFAAIEPKNKKNWHIHKIYVLPKHQGKGLGKKLITFIEQMAKELGSLSLTLNVNRYNQALLFYKSCGFVIIKEEDISIGSGYWMNDFLMQKTFED